jgi:hypothetical protein
MNRIRGFLYVAILYPLPIMVPARAADQRAVKFGTTLPATCWAGDIFFNTNAVAGSNLYACVALNTWVLQGGGSGGGASNAGQLTDFTDTRVSAIEVDTTLPAGGTRVRSGSVVRSITTSPEKMVGGGTWCAAGGQLWKYVDAATGAVKVDANANVTLANITFTAITPGSNSASGFPADGSTPIASYICGNNAANQWDTSPFADWRPFLGNDGFLAGPFATLTPGARWTIGVDTSRVGNGANASMLVGAVSPLSQSAGTPVCDDGSGGVKDIGCSGGGGGGGGVAYIPLPLCFNNGSNGLQGVYLWSPIATPVVGNVTQEPGAPCVLGFDGTSLSNGMTYNLITPMVSASSPATQVDVRYHYMLSGHSGSISLDWAVGCLPSGSTFNSTAISYGTAVTSSIYSSADNAENTDHVLNVNLPAACAADTAMKIRVKVHSALSAGSIYFMGISAVFH